MCGVYCVGWGGCIDIAASYLMGGWLVYCIWWGGGGLWCGGYFSVVLC